MTSIEERLAVLEDRDDDHRRFQDIVNQKLDALLAQSNELAGVRKTLAALVTIITLTGGLIGFAVHEFWPHAINGKS